VAVRLPRGRRGVLVLVVGFSVAAGGGALVGANFIRSPAQVAADAQPPPSGPVTVPVAKRVIRTTVVLRGDVEPESRFTVAAPAPRDAARPVLTRLPSAPSDEVRAGQVLADVSGRPVIALPGATPAYRDLTPGAEGDDVAQLQAALTALGHRPGDPDGVYGPGTRAAVTALYRAAGYEPQQSADSDAERLKLAKRQVRDLEQAHRSAPPETRAATAQRLADAREDLAEVVASTGSTVPVGEIAFVPTLPARVATVLARPGEQVTGDLMTLAGGPLVVRARVDERGAGLVRAGLPVEIVAELRGERAAGSVAGVAVADREPVRRSDTAAQPAQSAEDQRLVVLVHGEEPLPPTMAGQNVRLTIVSASTAEDVLVVPLAAVSSRADGQAVVVRVVDGREQQVVVQAGVSGGGFVEARPVDGGLAPGDRVVVGR